MDDRTKGRARILRSSWRARGLTILGLSVLGLALWSMPASTRAQEALPAPRAEGEPLDVVEFRDLTLRDALRLFSQQTGLNVVASSQAGNTPVTLYLTNVSPRAALDTLTKTHNLFYRQGEGGIITVYTNDEFDVNLRSFRDEQTRVFTLLYPNAFDAAQAVSDIYGDRVQMSFGANPGDQFRDLTERFDRFDLINGRSQGLGLFGGGRGAGGGGFGGGGLGGGGLGGGGFGGGGFGGGGFGGGGFGGGGGGFGGQLRSDLLRNGRVERDLVQNEANAIGRSEDRIDVSNLTPEQIQALVNAQQGAQNNQAVQDLLRSQQASIFITVIRRQNQIIVRTSDQETMNQIAELVARLDVPTPLVMLEVKILQVALDDDFNSVFDYQFSDNDLTAGQFTSGNILPPASDGLVGAARRAASLAPGGTGIREGDMLFQVVSNNFRFRMQLLETKNRVTELASPILLTANNEVSRIFVGEEVPLNRSFSGPQVVNTPVVGGAAFTAGTTAIEFRPVGTTLLLTPSINADRTVTLRLLQETSEIVPDGASVLVPTDTGFAPQLIDTVRTRTVTGTIVAKDGLAVALGGLIQESARDNRAHVPVVGKLPVVGFFFRRQNTVRERTELIVVIRPYIFNTPTETACVSRQLLDTLSLHPAAPDAVGTLGTFAPHEVVRPNPPLNPLQSIFRFHHVEPKVY